MHTITLSGVIDGQRQLHLQLPPDTPAAAALRALLDQLDTEVRPRPVFELATRLRAEQRLKTPDALPLAAAITAGCDHLMTNDQRLARAGSPGITMITLDPSASAGSAG